MRRWFTTPRSTSRVHTIAQVEGATEGWGMGRREATRSAVSGKSLARAPCVARTCRLVRSRAAGRHVGRRRVHHDPAGRRACAAVEGQGRARQPIQGGYKVCVADTEDEGVEIAHGCGRVRACLGAVAGAGDASGNCWRAVRRGLVVMHPPPRLPRFRQAARFLLGWPRFTSAVRGSAPPAKSLPGTIGPGSPGWTGMASAPPTKSEPTGGASCRIGLVVCVGVGMQ